MTPNKIAIALIALASFGCGTHEDLGFDIGIDSEPNAGDEVFLDEVNEIGELEQALSTRQTSTGNRCLGVALAVVGEAAIGGQCVVSDGARCVLPNSKARGYDVAADGNSQALKPFINALKPTLQSASTFTFPEVPGGGAFLVTNGSVAGPAGTDIQNYVSATFCNPTCLILSEPVGVPGTYRRGLSRMSLVIDGGKINGLCGGTGGGATGCFQRTLNQAIAYGFYKMSGIGGTQDTSTLNGFATGRRIDRSQVKTGLPAFQTCLGQNFGTSNENEITVVGLPTNCGAPAVGY